MDLNITSVADFEHTFTLPVTMSLIGAIIGHYGKNGIIQMPIIVIKFESGTYLKDTIWFKKPIRWLYIILNFLLFIIGFRINKNQDKDAISTDLGFFGDMLIGVGTGILAKCTLAVLNTPSEFVVISTSLLSGFAGLSYIKSKQDQKLYNNSNLVKASKINPYELGLDEAAAGSTSETTEN